MVDQAGHAGEADQLLTETVHNAYNLFTLVFSFRRISSLGMSSVTPQIQKEWLEYSELFRTDSEESKKAQADWLARTQLEGFQTSVDASSLVFAHSILDEIALEFCRVIALFSPLYWESYVENKSISLKEIKRSSYKLILEKKVMEYIESLDRQSLLVKLDKLFQLCKPPPDFSPLSGYVYDRSRLKKLDEMRHNIVHGIGPVVTLPNGDEDIIFMRDTVCYLVALVSQLLKAEP